MPRFAKSFTQQEPIPESAIECAVQIMRSGALHRYSVIDNQPSQTALLEAEFADYLGQRFVLACTSGGYALHIALKAAGLSYGDKVLCNAYTLAPVPGAIDNAGGVTVLVESKPDFTIDLDDLEQKAVSDDVNFLVLSHMRGHIVDMDELMNICDKHNVCVIEDAAHTMGANWGGKKSGTFGTIGCFSTQTYKHINSGEGGFISTDDEQVMAKAIMYSGSYMLFDNHIAAPDNSVFENIRLETPNYSGRMDNLRAALLRPQLAALDSNVERWNRLYRTIETNLAGVDDIVIAPRQEQEYFVGSSFQFRLPNFDELAVRAFIELNAADGVPIKWFGNENPQGYTSRFDSWRYLGKQSSLPLTLEILATTCDIRVPLTFTVEDCHLIASIIKDNVAKMNNQ
ncbi:MAG: dTDP-4-amino-4,6-dideoxygalactose transaminase [Arenicella sp.]|jgi:dTDP-4-amino-4,6-dideoxygalactose transaminase